jgi:serine/threonine-protein kinase
MGCVAYWLLTGKLVFDGDTPMAVMAKHVHETPAPLSKRTEIPIPAALEQIIGECLQKDPEKRPPSADAVAQALQAIDCEEPWTQVRARRWWEVHLPGSD